MDDIANDTDILRDVASLNVDGEIAEVKHTKMRVALNLSRKQSDLNYKEDFEMKISKMTDRMQDEMDDANKKLDFSSATINGPQSYVDVLDEGKRQKQEKELNRKKAAMKNLKLESSKELKSPGLNS